MNHTKRLKGITDRLETGMADIEAQYTPDQWHTLGGDAHHCATLERMNAPQIKRDRAVTRRALLVVCVAFGMVLAAIALSHWYDRAIDAIAVPHLEGF